MTTVFILLLGFGIDDLFTANKFYKFGQISNTTLYSHNENKDLRESIERNQLRTKTR